jgi:hypothetical protein
VTTIQQEELKWGETATVEGVNVTVNRPITDPSAKASQPGFMVVSSDVTITNTGGAPIHLAPEDFFLEGGRSGGGGMRSKPGSEGLQPSTLSPGETVTGAVRFNLHEDDSPILVWMLVPWSKQMRLNWR